MEKDSSMEQLLELGDASVPALFDSNDRADEAPTLFSSSVAGVMTMNDLFAPLHSADGLAFLRGEGSL